jgi:hypothetical protein
MDRTEIIRALDQEILRLHQVKALLQGTQKLSPVLSKLVGNTPSSRHRNISAEGRKRIAEAQRRRWAKQKRSK